MYTTTLKILNVGSDFINLEIMISSFLTYPYICVASFCLTLKETSLASWAIFKWVVLTNEAVRAIGSNIGNILLLSYFRSFKGSHS